MAQLESLLNRAFPWMAITGLLLAGWGLVVTPDNIKGNAAAYASSHYSLEEGSIAR